ncbi:MAG TPA: UDP-N-acetylglucosamine 2-epimerase (non-hydrolyzing) [Longimicrobiales bacterium]|nr:UDP-N-acetylglucosamine 2-epimerase (non-hydrolyzing) [Longimicrobiales bacterium]
MSAPARVLVVIGTRPEGIKLAPVVEALRREPGVEPRVALTGQHTDLLDQVLDVFRLGVDWDLGIMREGQDLYDVAAGCLSGLRDVYREFRPDLVLVQGDTATVFFGGLVAFFERTRVGHVEAGLRSGDKWRPYPEEVFRRLTGVVTDLHFAPTAEARRNLLAEGVDPAHVFLTGNTVVDALGEVAARNPGVGDPTLREVLVDRRRLVLVTAHRRESFGAPLREAFGAIRELADRHEDLVVLYPVHPNPNVVGPARELLSGHPRIHLTAPLGYLDLVQALRHSTLVLTDSGGIQEEAPTFGTPVLVLREVTERPEGVRAGVARLVGTDREKILRNAEDLLGDAATRERMAAARNPYGDGRAAERIADIVAHELTGRPRRTRDWEPPA